jgi:hypothetical protein
MPPNDTRLSCVPAYPGHLSLQGIIGTFFVADSAVYIIQLRLTARELCALCAALGNAIHQISLIRSVISQLYSLRLGRSSMKSRKLSDG